MYCGTKKGPVDAPRKQTEEEEYYVHRFRSKLLSQNMGFRGDDSEQKMWELWRKHGAVEAETPEQQEARYTGVDPESRERNPGLTKNKLQNPDIVATCGMDYLIRTWDPKTLARLQVFEGHTNTVIVVEQYHGRWLISCGDDGTVRLWELGTEKVGKLEKTIWVSCFPIKAMCVLPGHRVAAGTNDQMLSIVSVISGEILTMVDDHKEIGPWENYWQTEGAGCVCGLLHLRDNLMASSADDTTVRFWDVDTMKCLGIHVAHHGFGKEINSHHEFTRRWAPVWCMTHLGGDGTRFASGSWDRTIAVWDTSDIENIKILNTLRGHDNAVMQLATLEENIILSCGGDYCFKIWDVTTGECLHTVETRGLPLCGTRLTANCVLVGGGDSTIRVFDWKEGEDLLGERGFYAHELAIFWAAPVYKDEMDEDKQWLEPIMYRREDPFTILQHQDEAKDHPKNLRKKAIEFSKYGEWGETYAEPKARWSHYSRDFMVPDNYSL